MIDSIPFNVNMNVGIIDSVHSSDIHTDIEALKAVVAEQSTLLRSLQASVQELQEKNNFLENAYVKESHELQWLKKTLQEQKLLYVSQPNNISRNEELNIKDSKNHEEETIGSYQSVTLSTHAQHEELHEHLRIRASRLLTGSLQEDHVAFTAFHGGSNEKMSVGQTIALSDIRQNIGGSLHTNGIFAARTPGIYVFFYSINCDNQSHLFVEIVKDTTQLGRTYCSGHGGDHWVVSSSMATAVLSPGDTVWLRVYSISGDQATIGGDTSFTGFLLRRF
ncbi:uncharacterized protein LOC133203512 [Saccostrea echinata]|uniref:uncharacterized protein LOC133203512 n=1 Tax=Saccostrea echinata TaxID=191078 RepID=UPI002A833F74|nr:uncharacterized protein LOC133203512 [Saccostrea echinata]